jgi:hypothetical protein
MKNSVWGILSVVIVFFVSCVTTNISEPSEVVITREDTSGNQLEIVINDKHMGRLDSGQTRMFKIPNGHNIINGIRTENRSYSGSISFESSNERIEIIVDETRTTSFRILNRTILSQPQSLNPLRNSAINATFNTLNPLIPNSSKIAIVNITPTNSDTAFIQEELMVLFVNSQKFTVLDRQTLDSIREEQRFQMTGEVSDATAVSIGHFLGADVVIVGNIIGNVPQRRLRMRAINVMTAQVLAMSSEEI